MSKLTILCVLCCSGNSKVVWTYPEQTTVTPQEQAASPPYLEYLVTAGFHRRLSLDFKKRRTQAIFYNLGKMKVNNCNLCFQKYWQKTKSIVSKSRYLYKYNSFQALTYVEGHLMQILTLTAQSMTLLTPTRTRDIAC